MKVLSKRVDDLIIFLYATNHVMPETSVQHLAIIMDGNRRWAKEQGLPSFEGHRKGYDKLKDVGDWCLARGIKVFTVFAFSSENWRRSPEEVGFLMDLLERGLSKELDHFIERNIRIKVIGRREGLRESLVKAIQSAEERTANADKGTLCICLNYGGRAEIVDAVKKIIESGVEAADVTEERITQNLYWPEMPEPDLVIRTSGEERLSGFLTWESVYSEVFWCKHHWPAFEEKDLDAAIESFNERQRRYGK